MKAPQRYATRRALLAGFVSDFIRTNRDFLAPQVPLGEFYDLFLVASTVVLCNERGKDCTASKIARLLEMPRSTTLRKLNRCIYLGLVTRVGNVYCALRAPPQLRAAIAMRMENTLKLLSKMDE